MLLWPIFKANGAIDKDMIPPGPVLEAFGHLRDFTLFHTTVPAPQDLSLAEQLKKATKSLLSYSALIEQVCVMRVY